jgi:hypothetical protein
MQRPCGGAVMHLSLSSGIRDLFLSIYFKIEEKENTLIHVKWYQNFLSSVYFR